jgi:hypothetical protein
MKTEPEFQYYLDPGSQKFECPRCGKKRFVRYMDANGYYLDKIFGRCDREQNCSYRLHPNEFKPSLRPRLYPVPIQRIEIPAEFVKKSRHLYDKNTFCRYLVKQFGAKKASEAIRQFHLGTSTVFTNAVVFWQIDVTGIVRTGHIMQYDPKSGKRIGIQSWVHAEMRKNGLIPEHNELVQCFFGEHQLRVRPDDPVGIVESEKTAIIASIYFPEIIWLACCGKHGLNPAKSVVLKDRWIALYPDASTDGSTYKFWCEKATDMQSISDRIEVSHLLENFATCTQKANSIDIADFFLENSGAIRQKNY